MYENKVDVTSISVRKLNYVTFLVCGFALCFGNHNSDLLTSVFIPDASNIVYITISKATILSQ